MAHAVTADGRRKPLAVKVPQRITFLFWATKLLTTAGGEATSDYFSLKGHLEAGVIELSIFVVAVVIQFSTRRYVAAAYWFLALAIAIFGTGVADAMHLIVGIPYAGTTALWAIVLAVIFWLWYRTERTLSIHSIMTTRREVYYWATVFATFALGTALGDFTATALHLGYLASGVLFAVVIMVPFVAWWRLRMNSVLAFWFAYVVTRPLGASFADYFSKPHSISGLNYGDGPVAVVFLAAIVVLVAYIAIAKPDVETSARPTGRQPEPPGWQAEPGGLPPEPAAVQDDVPTRRDYR
jgi:uncharacterized membrane-anchored protein